MVENESSGYKGLWTAVAALMALLMLSSPFAVYLRLVDKGPTWLGLDDSARMALNWAWIRHINWGHDIIYTYGPLSFLSTRIGWGIAAAVFVLFDLLIALNFFFIFRDLILQTRYKVLGLLCVVIMTIAIPVFFGSGLGWLLTVFIYYWMYRCYASPRYWQFGILLLLITIAFYLKLNTGLFTIVFLVGYLGLMIFTKSISWKKAGIVFGALIMLILAGAWAFNVSLSAYVKGAVEVMKGYNDLLYLYEEHPKEEFRLLAIFWGMCAVLGLGLLFRLKQKDWVAAFLVLIAIAYMYLLKKQGLFRNDRQHIGEFFAFAPLIWLSGICFIIWPKQKDVLIFIASVFAIVCLCAPITDQAQSEIIVHKIRKRFTLPVSYLKEVAAYDTIGYADQQNKRILPPRVLQRIGNGTVDVFPWDANYILQNKLNYHPRPCFQTFQANSDYLQQVNYNFYVQKGPQYVIYDYDGIDNAYPFNDAPTLNLLLAHNYRVADTFTSNERWRILLERQQQAGALNFNQTNKSQASLNVPIPPAEAFLKFKVSYTLKGKLRAIWNRPAPLQIAYQRPDGQWEYHKTSPELLKTGVYAGYFIHDSQDFARFVAGDTAALEKIQAIKLVGNPGHYKNAIELSYFRIEP